MPWWNRPRPPTAPPPRPDPGRQAASIEALESGRLPLEAEARLTQQAERKAPWTSTLSADAFLQARALGLVPLGQVLGSTIMHISFNPQWLFNAWTSGDIRPLSHAYGEARDTALRRLRQEAAMLGAHGVVDVTLEVTRPEWGAGVLEFTAMGTAVRLEGVAAPRRPFLGTLSAVDTGKLFAAGYVPMDLVYATTAYYVLTTWGTEMAELSFQNQELGDFSQAVYDARDMVVAHMRDQAADVGADGVLGARWSLTVEDVEVERPTSGFGFGYGLSTHQDHILYLTVTGTAIGRLAAAQPVPAVLPVLRVNDRRGGTT